jgi:hypothetical protein
MIAKPDYKHILLAGNVLLAGHPGPGRCKVKKDSEQSYMGEFSPYHISLHGSSWVMVSGPRVHICNRLKKPFCRSLSNGFCTHCALRDGGRSAGEISMHMVNYPIQIMI